MFTTQQYEAYQNVINLELYHAFEWLIAKTSELETAMAVYREGKAEWIWTPALNPTRYFEQFNLRYHDGQAALDMAYEKLKAWPTGRVQLLERTELGYFFKLCGEMVERGTLAGLDVFHLIGQMTGGELQ